MRTVKLLLAVLSCTQIVVAQPIRTPTNDTTRLKTSFSVGDIHAMFQAPTEGFILSSLVGSVEPYYHASGLLFSVPSLTIDSAFTVQLRASYENANYSSSYFSSRNSTLWGRVSATLRVSVGTFLDSIRIHGGDLWRVTAGKGLALDYFEALGSNFRLVFDRFSFELTTIGAGWTTWDDIYIASVGYDSAIRVNMFSNHFNNFTDLDPTFDKLMFSVDGELKRKHLTTYGEVGYMLNAGPGFVVGVKSEHNEDWITIGGQIEFRKYHSKFLNTEYDYRFQAGFPYINTLTAIDKPVMTYRDFQNQNSALYVRIYGHVRVINNFIIGTNTEYFNKVFTDTYIGWRYKDFAEVTFGFLNKAFNLYDTLSSDFIPMFRQDGMALLRMRFRL